MKIVIASDAKQPNATYRGALLAAGALPEEVVVVTPGDPDPGASRAPRYVAFGCFASDAMTIFIDG